MPNHPLAIEIEDFLQARKSQKLEPIHKKLEKEQKSLDNDNARAGVTQRYQPEIDDVSSAFEPRTWLTNAAQRAKQISLATHSVKFIHSDAKASSVLQLDTSEVSNAYVTTASITKPAIDAVGNAAALDVAKLLQLEANGQTLAEAIQNKDYSALEFFAENPKELKTWVAGLEQALTDARLATHPLAKQVYFPMADDYHLLCPLFSSSLAHELVSRVNHSRYSEESKQAREARRKSQYSETVDTRYPDLAVQTFGGSKPQNISQLNSSRGGKAYLLNAAPPNWQSSQKPPLAHGSIFRSIVPRRSRFLLAQFKAFLNGIQDRNSNVNLRDRRDQVYVRALVDEVLNYAAEIQALTEHSGWSASIECRLDRAQCLWLDCYYEDEAFQREREVGDWQNTIAQSFGLWLNQSLKSDQLVLAAAEAHHWQKQFAAALREFEHSLPAREEI